MASMVETVYRFCVRKKPDLAVPQEPRRIFITRSHLTDEQAQDRYEIIERLEHTKREIRAMEAGPSI